MATNSSDQPADKKSAADLIRQKVARLYAREPDVREELVESQTAKLRSKHQQFMYDLGTSGKDLATIQTEWHNYYQSLPAKEKHQVWQEFYASQSTLTGQAVPDEPQVLAEHKQHAARPKPRKKKTGPKLRDVRSAQELQATIRHKVTAGGKLGVKHHVQSLMFGLGMGAFVLVIFLFSFFNEVFIAPFIQPSRVTAATPLIINADSVAPSDKPEVIIPKINVQIPVIYGQSSIEENVLQSALESGVIHYPTTTLPGQTGNTAVFGHSSNNIFNKGKYKFAFVLLRTMVNGDTFYLTYGGKIYAYEVIDKKVVDPGDVSILNPVAGQAATATLITCDPPGTTLKRMVVIGKQISPDPTGNAAGTAAVQTTPPPQLPGQGPTLLGRFMSTPVGKGLVIILVAGGGLIVVRQLNQRFALTTIGRP